MDLFKDSLIIEEADEEHRANTGENPIDLPDVGSGKFRVLGCTMYLQHA
jgi:hypothetical protein